MLFNSSSYSGETTSRLFCPFTLLSELCLSGERVRTVIVSRVTRELRSVRRSEVVVPLVCLRVEVEVFLSVAEEPDRVCGAEDILVAH